MKAYFSLKGALCPRIKQSPYTPISIFKSATTTFLIVFCFVFAAKAKEGGVHSPPVAKAEKRLPLSRIIRFIALLFLFLSFGFPQEAKAQFEEPSGLTVRQGEEIPDYLWNLEHVSLNAETGERKTLKLGDYQDKLIILDFWASWCGGCISSLIKFDSIKPLIPNEKVVIIPINYEDEVRASRVFNNFDWDYQSVIEDTILTKVFPHQSIPHMVWLRDGKVWGFPTSAEISTENIMAVMNGGNPDLDMLYGDRSLDLSKELFVGENSDAKTIYTSSTCKIVEGNKFYRRELLKLVEEGDSVHIYGNNVDIKNLLRYAYQTDLFHPYLMSLKKGLLTDEVDDKDALNRFLALKFGFSMRIPKTEQAELFRMIQTHIKSFLEKYANLNLEMVQVDVGNYPVLESPNGAEQATNLLRSKYHGTKEKIMRGPIDIKHYGRPFGSLMRLAIKAALNTCNDVSFSVNHLIDDSGIDPLLLCDFSFNYEYDGLASLNRHLTKYGLAIKVDRDPVNILKLSTLKK